MALISVSTLDFKSVHKALYDGVIVGISGSAHTDGANIFIKQRLVYQAASGKLRKHTERLCRTDV